MADHIDRMRTEFGELNERLTKLRIFIGGDVYDALSGLEKILLNQQASFMERYLQTLHQRIDLAVFPPEGPTPEEALDLEFYCNDLGENVTIRGYFQRLLTTLFDETEGFSGKRPFGNSGWEYDIIKPLVIAGAVKGDIDAYEEDGESYIELGEFDKDAADKFITAMIEAL